MLKRNAMVNKELYIAQLHCVNEAIQLKRPIDKAKPYFFMTMPGLMLHKLSKPHSKSSNGRSFSICHILWTLHPWITIFCALCQTIWGALPSTMKRTLKTGSTNSSIPAQGFLAEQHRQIGQEVGGGRKQQQKIHNLLIYSHNLSFLFK